ncbi:MAG TPA: ABC transporter permease [Candidatus Binatia bacterium]|nr:ABC transporter permease [Candidatus Binatia bacterium]
MTRTRHFWSNVAAVAYKEASVVRHDQALLATVLAQPVMMMLLFGLALSNKPANVPWAVLDQSRTALSRRLLEEVRTTGYFVPPRAVASYEEGRALLQRGGAVAFVVIPTSFRRDAERGTPQIQVLLDGSDPLTAARVSGYINQVAATFAVHPDPSDHRPETHVRSPGLIDLRQRFWFNPTLADQRFFLAALAGMLLTNLCLSATSGGLVAERESGTYEQMLALPTRPIEIVLGKLVPFVGLSYLVMLGATIGAGIFFGVWPAGSWFTLIVVTLPFVLASLAIGVFISTLAHTSAQAVFITVFFILPSFVLSGSMFPYQLMPHGIREFGGLFPLRWYQIASRRIVERGAGFAEVLVPTFALMALFGLILAGIRWRMKPRLG